ncbi:MAG: cytochrome c oxidase subunit 3 [Methylocystis sp.]
MSVMGLFFVLIASISLWWLVRQGVLRSSYAEEGEIADFPGAELLPRPPAAKVGLGVFLAVAGCLFSLLCAAFFMRMDAPDWVSPPVPGVLWFNTGVLIASSLALHLAQTDAARGEADGLKSWLLVAGGCALVFLLGQLWAWRELAAQGLYASSNPANAFFYLLTATHALHLVGGLAALARTAPKAWSGRADAALATSVELCALYWHFLLFVWLLLFAMFAGWADNFGVICRRLLG